MLCKIFISMLELYAQDAIDTTFLCLQYKHTISLDIVAFPRVEEDDKVKAGPSWGPLYWEKNNIVNFLKQGYRYMYSRQKKIRSLTHNLTCVDIASLSGLKARIRIKYLPIP